MKEEILVLEKELEEAKHKHEIRLKEKMQILAENIKYYGTKV